MRSHGPCSTRHLLQSRCHKQRQTGSDLDRQVQVTAGWGLQGWATSSTPRSRPLLLPPLASVEVEAVAPHEAPAPPSSNHVTSPGSSPTPQTALKQDATSERRGAPSLSLHTWVARPWRSPCPRAGLRPHPHLCASARPPSPGSARHPAEAAVKHTLPRLSAPSPVL